MSNIHDKICLYASENGVYFGKTVFQWKATRDTNLLKGEDIEAFIVEQLGCDPLHTDSVYVVEVDIVDGIISTDGMSGTLSDLAAYVFAVSKIYEKIGWPKESDPVEMVDTIFCRKATDLRWIISRHSKKCKDGLMFDESFQKARILGDCELNLWYDASGDLCCASITYIERGTTVSIGRKMLEHRSEVVDLVNDIYSVIGKPEFAKKRDSGVKDSQRFTDVIYCHRHPGTNDEWFVSRDKGIYDIFQSKIPGDTTIIDRELFRKAGIHRDSELKCCYDEDGNLNEITVIETDVPHLAANFNLSLEADTPLPKLIKAIYSGIKEPLFIKKKVPVAGLDNFCKALEYCRKDLDAISELFEKAKQEPKFKKSEYNFEIINLNHLFSMEACMTPGFLIKDIDVDRVTVISPRTDEYPEVYHLLAGKITIRNTRLTFYVSENCDTVKLRYGTLDYDGAAISGGLKTDDTRELLTGLLEALGGDVD